LKRPTRDAIIAPWILTTTSESFARSRARPFLNSVGAPELLCRTLEDDAGELLPQHNAMVGPDAWRIVGSRSEFVN
jgi:hypothetical protein